MEHFEQKVTVSRIDGKVLLSLLEVVPTSCTLKDNLEDYNEGTQQKFIERLWPVQGKIDRPGQKARDYKVWAYKITNPRTPDEVGIKPYHQIYKSTCTYNYVTSVKF